MTVEAFALRPTPMCSTMRQRLVLAVVGLRMALRFRATSRPLTVTL